MATFAIGIPGGNDPTTGLPSALRVGVEILVQRELAPLVGCDHFPRLGGREVLGDDGHVLPESVNFATAASLGCRFVTSFRAVVDHGKVTAGQWVAVHGCGGVGLAAIMIANSLGANVVAVDIADDKLALAKRLGAAVTLNASSVASVAEAVIEVTKGGAHVSLDALGSPVTCFNSIQNLRRRGKHVQVGLMLGEHSTPAVPMSKIFGWELEVLGSHGMQAHRCDAMMPMILSGKLKPELLVGKEISLAQSIDALVSMDKFQGIGTTVVTRF